MDMKKSLLTAIMALLTVLVFGTMTALAAGTDYGNGTITAEGSGAAPAAAGSPGRARMLARRAALVDAYRGLAEQIQGVDVEAETTVQDMAVASDLVRTKVSALVKGSKVVSEQYNADGTYQVKLSVPLYGVSGSVASAVWTKPAAREAFPVPASARTGSSAAAVPAAAAGIKAVGHYTGLIVDCRGLGLRPVMSPVIKNADGQAVYGYKNLDYQKVIARGMAGYTTDISLAARAGTNPLLVKAARLDNHQGNPVLALADADRVLVENQASGFLDDCAVVFVR
jgi:hypothetical protein